jgi:flagellar biosynthetic protein FliQ
MNTDVVSLLAFHAIELAAGLSAAILLPSALIGLFSSVMQAATQIQDSSLSFLPKLLGTGAAVVFFGPWALSWFSQFCAEIFQGLLSVSLYG